MSRVLQKSIWHRLVAMPDENHRPILYMARASSDSGSLYQNPDLAVIPCAGAAWTAIRHLVVIIDQNPGSSA